MTWLLLYMLFTKVRRGGFPTQEQCIKENENGPSRPETEFRSRVSYTGMLGLSIT